MKKICFLITCFCCSMYAQAQQPAIVSPQWLHDHISDSNLVIIYTGFVIRADFEREHIEGSRFLWPDWLAPNTPEHL